MERIHWIGLESYSEENASLFFGRDREIEALSNSIFHNNQTIIFGPSGVGKSSIIKAGVMRMARRKDFLPVYIRLSFNEDADGSYVRQVITAVKEEARRRDVEVERRIDYVDAEDVSLWEFFHCNGFVNVYDLPVIPLIIIDQFEEIFTLSRDRAETERFFRNISELCDNITPEYIKKHLSESNRYTKYPEGIDIRLVFSLREDFLARLEEQAANIPSLKRNRFSLQPINGEQAMEIIMRPEPGLVAEDVAMSIIRTVTGNASVRREDLRNVEVEPSLLSLFCSELDMKRVVRGESVISQELVDEAGKNIINDFYREKVGHISDEAVEFLESKLLTKNGFRNSAPLEDTLSDAKGLTQAEYEFLSKNRILRTEERNGMKRIEFTHDILCKAASDYRDYKRAVLKQQEELKRQEEEHQKQIAQQEQEKLELMKQKEEELLVLDGKRRSAKRRLIRTILLFLAAAVVAGGVIVFLMKKIDDERESFRNQIGKFNVTISLSEDETVKSLWWEATLRVKSRSGEKDTLLLDTVINKATAKSALVLPIDSTSYSKLLVSVGYAASSNFAKFNKEFEVRKLIDEPNVVIPVKLKDPINYGGQLVMKDSRTGLEFFIKNAIVVLNNEVDFTDSEGRFLFQLQDTLKPGDQMIIVKNGYASLSNNNSESLKELRLETSAGDFKKILLEQTDSDTYRNRIAECDSIVAILDSIKKNCIYRELPIEYTNSKGGAADDQISLYMMAHGKTITGFYVYRNEMGKKSSRYRYHVFTGIIGKSERDAKDGLNYRSFELTSHDVANNEETIKGRLGTLKSKRNCELKIFTYSRQIGASIKE